MGSFLIPFSIDASGEDGVNEKHKSPNCVILNSRPEARTEINFNDCNSKWHGVKRLGCLDEAY